MDKKVIGLDLSLCNSAYHDGEGVYCGIIKSKLRDAHRLLEIRREIFKVLEAMDPQLVVVEDYSYGSRGNTFSIGELGGVIKLGLFERGFRVLLVPPKSLKKFIAGNGNASKDLMMLKTYKKYDVEFEDNNLCDAFGLVQVGKAYLKGTDINYEKEVLKKVEVYC